MRHFVLIGAIATGSIAITASAQTAPASEVTAAPAAPVVAAPAVVSPPIQLIQPAPLVLPRDTPIHLMVVSEVTTKTHAAGHRFRLRVNEPVRLAQQTIIPVGASAWGEVLSAESSGNLGRSGRLSARLLYVEANGRNIPISGELSSKGNSGTAETVMGVLSLGVFGLFAKGNNAKLKAGELMTAFTTEDALLASPAAGAPPAAPAVTP